MDDRKRFLRGLSKLNVDISDAQLVLIDEYVTLLQKWQKSFNLIGPDTVPYIYTRHVLDSAQLVPFMSAGDSVVDIGAGAGLPSIVLSILMDVKVVACERNGKKAQFLNEARRKLKLKDFEVANVDVCELNDSKNKFSVVTARAFSDLKFILNVGDPLLKDGGRYILLKGETVKDEISNSNIKNRMTSEIKKSITSSGGNILILS